MAVGWLEDGDMKRFFNDGYGFSAGNLVLLCFLVGKGGISGCALSSRGEVAGSGPEVVQWSWAFCLLIGVSCGTLGLLGVGIAWEDGVYEGLVW